jgi:hypothetical protein
MQTRRPIPALFLLALIFTATYVFPAYAQNNNTLNSTSYKTVISVGDSGGNASSASFKGDLGVFYLQGVSNSSSQRVCLGFLCVDYAPAGETVLVSFVLEANLSGAADDTVLIDNSTSPGLYKAGDISRYFACIQDTSLTDSPLVGVVYAGSGGFRYVRADSGSSFIIRLTQVQPGNKFVIPVTQDGCSVVRNKLPLSVPSILTLPFVAVGDLSTAVEFSVSAPIDLVGSFERTGSFTLVLEKNETQIIGDTV